MRCVCKVKTVALPHGLVCVVVSFPFFFDSLLTTVLLHNVLMWHAPRLQQLFVALRIRTKEQPRCAGTAGASPIPGWNRRLSEQESHFRAGPSVPKAPCQFSEQSDAFIPGQSVFLQLDCLNLLVWELQNETTREPLHVVAHRAINVSQAVLKGPK